MGANERGRRDIIVVNGRAMRPSEALARLRSNLTIVVNAGEGYQEKADAMDRVLINDVADYSEAVTLEAEIQSKIQRIREGSLWTNTSVEDLEKGLNEVQAIKSLIKEGADATQRGRINHREDRQFTSNQSAQPTQSFLGRLFTNWSKLDQWNEEHKDG